MSAVRHAHAVCAVPHVSSALILHSDPPSHLCVCIVHLVPFSQQVASLQNSSLSASSVVGIASSQSNQQRCVHPQFDYCSTSLYVVVSISGLTWPLIDQAIMLCDYRLHAMLVALALKLRVAATLKQQDARLATGEAHRQLITDCQLRWRSQVGKGALIANCCQLPADRGGSGMGAFKLCCFNFASPNTIKRSN